MDAVAFDQLWEEHSGAIWAYARRRTDHEAALEVVADTFLVAWRRMDELPAAPRPWLYGVARRVLANRRRSTDRQAAVADRLMSQPVVVADDLVDLDLQAALSGLPARDREVLLLCYWEGLSYREVAETLGCSVTAAGVRLHRAKARLRAVLATADRTSTEVSLG